MSKSPSCATSGAVAPRPDTERAADAPLPPLLSKMCQRAAGSSRCNDLKTCHGRTRCWTTNPGRWLVATTLKQIPPCFSVPSFCCQGKRRPHMIERQADLINNSSFSINSETRCIIDIPQHQGERMCAKRYVFVFRPIRDIPKCRRCPFGAKLTDFTQTLRLHPHHVAWACVHLPACLITEHENIQSIISAA